MYRIEGTKLIIELDMNSKELSSTKKSYLVATSHGYQEGEVEVNGSKVKVGISYNVTRRV